MAFTTWTDLKFRMMDDLATGNWTKVINYSVSTADGSRSFSYRSFDEWKKIFDMVSQNAAAESNGAPYVGRMRGGM